MASTRGVLAAGLVAPGGAERLVIWGTALGAGVVDSDLLAAARRRLEQRRLPARAGAAGRRGR